MTSFSINGSPTCTAVRFASDSSVKFLGCKRRSMNTIPTGCRSNIKYRVTYAFSDTTLNFIMIDQDPHTSR